MKIRSILKWSTFCVSCFQKMYYPLRYRKWCQSDDHARLLLVSINEGIDKCVTRECHAIGPEMFLVWCISKEGLFAMNCLFFILESHGKKGPNRIIFTQRPCSLFYWQGYWRDSGYKITENCTKSAWELLRGRRNLNSHPTTNCSFGQ